MKNPKGIVAPTLIIGLGNPGPRYVHTLHNVGAEAIAYLERHAEKSPVASTPLFHYHKTTRGILVTSTLFMNESGRAVKSALREFRKKPGQLLVIHDESDLPIGSSRLSFGRGAAGHRGVQSIIDALGTKAFFRFRIGIRRGTGKAEEFVLTKMRPEEKSTFHLVFEELSRKVNEKENP